MLQSSKMQKCKMSKVLSVEMPRNNVKYYYAVGRGRQTGVFDNWPDCRKQVNGINNARYKKFPTYPEAEEFVNHWKNYVSPPKFHPQTNPQPLPQSQSSVKQELVSGNNFSTNPCIFEYDNTLNGLGVKIKRETIDGDDFIPLADEKNENNEKINIENKKLNDSVYFNFVKINLRNLKDKPPLSVLNLIELEKKLKERAPLQDNSSERIVENELRILGIELLNKETMNENVIQTLTDIVKNIVYNLNSHQFKEPERKGELQAENLSINLRLDAFEKRFDALLKEVGAIASDVNEIKMKVLNIELKNSKSIDTTKSSAPGEPSKPKKRKLSPLPKEDDQAEPVPSTSTNNPSTSSNDLVIKEENPSMDLLTFDVGPDDYVTVYTDGCCRNNGKASAKAGIGIYFGEDHPLNVSQPLDGPATNNNGEIQAARIAIELAAEAGVTKLKVHTDSGFLLDCVNNYMRTWRSNGWRLSSGQPVKNRVELEKLDMAIKLISVKWEKVPAHKGIHGNEMADKLANAGALQYRSR